MGAIFVYLGIRLVGERPEVAERLGISENTVRTHVVRGMERCTDYLRARGVNRGQKP